MIAASEFLGVLESDKYVFCITFLSLKNCETCMTPRDLDGGFESCCYILIFSKAVTDIGCVDLSSTSAGYIQLCLLRFDLHGTFKVPFYDIYFFIFI